MNPISTIAGMTKVAAGHLRDHALSRTPKPDLMDVLTQTQRSPIIEVIEKHRPKPKRSIDSDDSQLRYPFKSPILLKKPKKSDTAVQPEADEPRNACDARDIHVEAIGEHLVDPVSRQTAGRMAELNEDAADANQPSYRVRRSEDVPEKQPNDADEVHGCGTPDCPVHKHSAHGACPHGTCTKTQ